MLIGRRFRLKRIRPIRLVLVCLLILVSLSLSFRQVYSASQTDAANSAIEQANSALSSSFLAVSDAERAGADVSGLRRSLNVAMDLFSQAKMMLASGNPAGAVQAADLASETAKNVGNSASSLEALAIASNQFSFRSSLINSTVALAAFLVGLLLLWWMLRRRYVRGIGKLRPEVVVPDA